MQHTLLATWPAPPAQVACRHRANNPIACAHHPQRLSCSVNSDRQPRLTSTFSCLHQAAQSRAAQRGSRSRHVHASAHQGELAPYDGSTGIVIVDHGSRKKESNEMLVSETHAHAWDPGALVYANAYGPCWSVEHMHNFQGHIVHAIDQRQQVHSCFTKHFTASSSRSTMTHYHVASLLAGALCDPVPAADRCSCG